VAVSARPTEVSAPAAAETPDAAAQPAGLAWVGKVQIEPGAEYLEIRLTTDSKVARILRSEAVGPPRLIFDLLETSSRIPLASKTVGKHGVERVRFGIHNEKIRIVLDLTGPLPTVETEFEDSGVVLRVK
jgi:hypothetical protein